MDRRDFLRCAGSGLACGRLTLGQAHKKVILVVDPSDTVATAPPVQWAAHQLRQALLDAGFPVEQRERPGANEFSIIACGPSAPFAVAAFRDAAIAAPNSPESLALFEVGSTSSRSIVAGGFDVRGLAYALTELADRVRHGRALQIDRPILENSSNPVRSVMRQFTSELLDKPWFYDREQWPAYLDLLATQRFNRLHLAFGFGYDSLNRVDDSYFLFLYPFVVSLPGYPVRATNLSDSERDRNLQMLQFISEETIRRGMDFQLGIWMHGYLWPNSPRAQNTIEGLTAETHGPYCRDALTAILRKCPAISSVGLRIHGESGVAEGSYEFWATVFDGVKRCGRTVEMDLHAKGIDDTMIQHALATGLPVNLSPKYSAEHFGMPYHQAAIRELEMPEAGRTGSGLMTLSEGSRVFTRYGYADLLRDDRKYTVRHRVFSGTQRILLWHDPVFTAAYSRMFQFCGSTGADLMEPLTCRGRRGSAVPGRRSGYTDASLEPRWDWEKYASWYRVWGRLMYNPDSSSEVLARPFGPRTALQSALSSASRILPIVTTAYLPSAACDGYWPEIYWNQPMVAPPKDNPYGDTLAPKVFQNASPLDPQLFSSMRECAQELLGKSGTGKYSPIEVAQWLDDFATKALEGLKSEGKPQSPDARRIAIDVQMQAGIGRFFAAKFRAGVLYSIYEQAGYRAAFDEALRAYRTARVRWNDVADLGKTIYAADLSASNRFDERGQWLDRLQGIDQDIADLERQLARSSTFTGVSDIHTSPARLKAAITEVLVPPKRDLVPCHHSPPAGFRPKESVMIDLDFPQDRVMPSALLYYRHVNQAERYQQIEMTPRAGGCRAEIPAAYTDSPYPLQYYFQLRTIGGGVSLFPGLGSGLNTQPYFLLRRQVTG
jgi:hypothetical protein